MEQSKALAELLAISSKDQAEQLGADDTADEAIRCATPTKYADRSGESGRHILTRSPRPTSDLPPRRGLSPAWRRCLRAAMSTSAGAMRISAWTWFGWTLASCASGRRTPWTGDMRSQAASCSACCVAACNGAALKRTRVASTQAVGRDVYFRATRGLHSEDRVGVLLPVQQESRHDVLQRPGLQAAPV